MSFTERKASHSLLYEENLLAHFDAFHKCNGLKTVFYIRRSVELKDVFQKFHKIKKRKKTKNLFCQMITENASNGDGATTFMVANQ